MLCLTTLMKYLVKETAVYSGCNISNNRKLVSLNRTTVQSVKKSDNTFQIEKDAKSLCHKINKTLCDVMLQ